jgi:hypothetical protein
MSKNRKSDKARLKEGRGLGSGEAYRSFIKGHEFSSDGLIHRPIGWKQRRIYQLFSNLEYHVFLISQFSDKVIDIREQVPLLPLELTKQIANDLGIKHPAEYNQKRKETVRTTDFLFTIREGDSIKVIAKSVKHSDTLKDARTRELLKIEEEYWKKKNIEWSIITQKEINKIMAENISIIYDDYFWAEDKEYSDFQVDILVKKFQIELDRNNMDPYKTLCEFERIMNWNGGEGLSFFKFMLASKIIKTDFNIPFNFMKMKVWI